MWLSAAVKAVTPLSERQAISRMIVERENMRDINTSSWFLNYHRQPSIEKENLSLICLRWTTHLGWLFEAFDALQLTFVYLCLRSFH